MGGRSDEREAFSSSVSKRAKESHQREASTDLVLAIDGASKLREGELKTLEEEGFSVSESETQIILLFFILFPASEKLNLRKFGLENFSLVG